MGMTREEAAHILEYSRIVSENFTQEAVTATYVMALAALRGPTREQVEKVWRGEWMALDECSNEGVYCKRCKKKVYRIEYANEKMRSPFCPACGAAQTDEAVEITMRRLEALNEED